jgi:hypothetical protein
MPRIIDRVMDLTCLQLIPDCDAHVAARAAVSSC